MELIQANDLLDQIRMQKMDLNTNDPESIDLISRNIQDLFLKAVVPPPVEQAILDAYERFVDDQKTNLCGHAKQRNRRGFRPVVCRPVYYRFKCASG